MVTVTIKDEAEHEFKHEHHTWSLDISNNLLVWKFDKVIAAYSQGSWNQVHGACKTTKNEH